MEAVIELTIDKSPLYKGGGRGRSQEWTSEESGVGARAAASALASRMGVQEPGPEELGPSLGSLPVQPRHQGLCQLQRVLPLPLPSPRKKGVIPLGSFSILTSVTHDGSSEGGHWEGLRQLYFQMEQLEVLKRGGVGCSWLHRLCWNAFLRSLSLRAKRYSSTASRWAWR